MHSVGSGRYDKKVFAKIGQFRVLLQCLQGEFHIDIPLLLQCLQDSAVLIFLKHYDLRFVLKYSFSTINSGLFKLCFVDNFSLRFYVLLEYQYALMMDGVTIMHLHELQHSTTPLCLKIIPQNAYITAVLLSSCNFRKLYIF